MEIKHLLSLKNYDFQLQSPSNLPYYNRFKRVRYEFRFTSLIAPGSAVESHSSKSELHANRNGFKRVLLKRSYLVLSWFYYLSLREYQGLPKAKSLPTVRLAILPPKQNMYTLTKAPMAHKTNSKEQFLFKHYNFKFSVTLKMPAEMTSSAIGQGAYSMHLVREDFPVFETNLLFLKYAKVSLPCKDSLFFSNLTPSRRS